MGINHVLIAMAIIRKRVRVGLLRTCAAVSPVISNHWPPSDPLSEDPTSLLNAIGNK